MAVIIQHFNINTSTPTTAPTMDDSLRSKNVVGLHGKKTTPKIQSNNNNNDNNTNRITLNSHKHNKNINNNNISNTITNTIIPTTTTTNNNNNNNNRSNNISIAPQPNQSPPSIANESQLSSSSNTNPNIDIDDIEAKNNTENNKDIGPKIKDKDNGIEIDNISAIIPEQPNKHYLSIIVSPEWNDSKLIPELVRHISQHTGKHIGDAYISNRIRLGFFTAKNQSVATQFVRNTREQKVKCWG
eukprot:26172_1